MDDGSTDETDKLMADYCEKDSRFKYYKREILPKGASQCRNIAIERAKGNYCIFLDSDDLLLDFCIERRLENVELFPDNHFWVFPMFKINHKLELIVCSIPKKESYLEEFLSCKIHWQTMCTFWDIKFLKSIKGFNILYPRLNDPEIHIRAMLEAKSKYVVFFENEPDSIYRVDAEPKEATAFALKYNQSLTLFIPDISQKLIEHNKKNNIPFLKEYLKDYIRTSYNHIKRKSNVKLFSIFHKNDILSYHQYKYLTSLYYFSLLLNKCIKKTRREIDNLL